MSRKIRVPFALALFLLQGCNSLDAAQSNKDKAETLELEKSAQEYFQKQSQERYIKLQAEIQKEELARPEEAKRKIDNQYNRACLSCGLVKGTDGFANCRMKLQEAREKKEAEQAALQQYQQQEIQIQQQLLQIQQQQALAQQNADEAARWQNFSKSMQDAARWMQPPPPTPPTTTNYNCVPISGGMSCHSAP
jgi:hypothetical protein